MHWPSSRSLALKRLLDLFIIAMSSLIIIPLVVVVALIVASTLGRPVLFRQARPGKNGKPFVMYKFRTMLDTRDSVGTLLSDEARLTGFGRLLRATSLDELPELWNVVKGDMSLVGPRPLLMEYLPLYSSEQRRRHEVLPGLTGWAQVNGRNAVSWKEKFELDVWYVDNRSIWLDMKILFLTVAKVLKREGINQEGHVTMERFRGNADE